MKSYIWGQILAYSGQDGEHDVRPVVLLSPIWLWISHQFHTDSWIWISPFTWVGILWSIDFAIGSSLAIYRGNWEAKKGKQSIVKLCLWMCALLVALILRKFAVGGIIPASCIETGAMFVEASSIFGHLASLSGNKRQKQLFRSAQDGADSAIEKLSDKMAGRAQ